MSLGYVSHLQQMKFLTFKRGNEPFPLGATQLLQSQPHISVLSSPEHLEASSIRRKQQTPRGSAFCLTHMQWPDLIPWKTSHLRAGLPAQIPLHTAYAPTWETGVIRMCVYFMLSPRSLLSRIRLIHWLSTCALRSLSGLTSLQDSPRLPLGQHPVGLGSTEDLPLKHVVQTQGSMDRKGWKPRDNVYFPPSRNH